MIKKPAFLVKPGCAVILVVAALLLQGCYGEMQLTRDYGYNSSYSNDSSKVLFYAFIRAYRPAKGLPETPIIRYRNTSLYLLNIEEMELTRLMDFDRLMYSRSRWETFSLFMGDTIAFSISPTSGWESELRWGMDSSIAAQHDRWYIAGPDGRLTGRADTINTARVTGHPCSQGELNALTSGIDFIDWEADMERIFPRGRGKRVKQITELYGNQLYRDALIEHTCPDMSVRAVERIIRNIERRYERMDEPDRLRNRHAKENTVNKLLQILEEI